MDISYEEFKNLSQEQTERELRNAQLLNDLNNALNDLKNERALNQTLREENKKLMVMCERTEFENSLLKRYILLSKDKVAEFSKSIKNISSWSILRAFVVWALPDEYREQEMPYVDEAMGLPMENASGIVMNQPTFKGPMYDVHGNSDVDINGQ